MKGLAMVVCTGMAAAALLGVGCGEGGGETQASGEPTSPAWVLTSAPESAMGIAEAKANAEEGDRIVLRGRIGGRKQPIAADSPVFTVMDLGVPHCGELHGDRCATPWDYCCETPDAITANAATVQIVDADGMPVGSSPSAFGFAPLDEVVVVGTVAPRPQRDVLTVRATGVFRAGS